MNLLPFGTGLQRPVFATILTRTDLSMKMAREKIFEPVVCVQSFEDMSQSLPMTRSMAWLVSGRRTFTGDPLLS